MNNKGQTLVLFIILIPILLILLAFIIDTGILVREANRLNSVTKTVLKDTYKKDDKEKLIKELLEKNKIKTDNLKLKIIKDQVNVKNSYEIESVFGKIIGIKNYTVKTDLTVYEEDGVLKFKKGIEG